MAFFFSQIALPPDVYQNMVDAKHKAEHKLKLMCVHFSNLRNELRQFKLVKD